MTTSDDLVETVVTLLTGATACGKNVYTPRTWPMTAEVLPVILVQSPDERKESLGRTASQFTVTTTVRVVARIASKSGANDRTAMAVQASLAILQRQIEVAVINATPLMTQIQQIAAVRASNKVDSSGERHVGELTVDLDLEFYQGPEDFAPNDGDPLDALKIYADLVNVFDANGTYADPPFPDAVQPAPRSEGPDGRSEAVAQFDLTQ